MTLTIGIAAWLTALALFCFVRRNARDVDLPYVPFADLVKHHADQRREGGKVRGFDQFHGSAE